jgi:Ca2+-binding RTX toxin-like protein
MSVTFTASSRVKEGEKIQLTVNRTGSDLERTQSFEITSIDLGTNAFARASNSDFEDSALENGLNFAPGEASKTLSVKVLEDYLMEGTEYLSWQIKGTSGGPQPLFLNTFASTTIENVERPLYALTYLDSAVTVTEGQDIVLRMKLNTANHNGVSFRPTEFFSPTANQFHRFDLVNQDNTTYIFPVVTFASGKDYTEMRIGTVDDSIRELDKTIQMRPSSNINATLYSSATLEGERLQFIGSPVITLLDNDWGSTVNNVNNISITGNSNIVNVTNNTVTSYGNTAIDGRTYNNVKGTETDDVLTGAETADNLEGGSGNDNLTGGLGDDRVMGGLGTDILFGNQGNDILFGNEGADFMYGGKGDDLLSPGQGNDIVYGNTGADKFILCKGQDTIKDFNFAEGDRILVYGDALISYGMSGGNLQIYRGTDTITTLEGVTFATFDPTTAVLAMG